MDSTPSIADLGPLNRAREQKAWFFSDWANSAFATTIAGVLFAPYLIAIAERSACGFVGDDDRECNATRACSASPSRRGRCRRTSSPSRRSSVPSSTR